MKKIFKILIPIILILCIVILGIIMINGNGDIDDNKILEENLEVENKVETESENETEEDDEIESEESNMNSNKIKLIINDSELTATLVENSSTEALIEKLQEGSITIDMHDYSNFEKVGSLGFSLPRNDENITTDFGDLILYQGNSFVIYYDTNTWSFTRLGKIDNISQEELMNILGDGNVTVTIDLIQ